MSKDAKLIREVALNFSEELAREKIDYALTPVRYFSRQSMLGRIDMSKLWRNFKPLPEMPGPLVLDKKEVRLLEGSEFKFLYSFLSDKKKRYNVFKGNEGYFVRDHSQKRLYYYRNPNYFKYFIEK